MTHLAILLLTFTHAFTFVLGLYLNAKRDADVVVIYVQPVEPVQAEGDEQLESLKRHKETTIIN